MGTNERVIQFIDYKGISKYKFCKDLGFSNKFLDNSSNMGTDKACKILLYFPELNANWLLTGNESMLKIIDDNIINPSELITNQKLINQLKRENEMQIKYIASLERENQLMREAKDNNQDKSKSSNIVANVVG